MTAERSPLVGFAAPFAEASARSNGTLTIAEKPLWSQVNLRIDPADAPVLTAVLGGVLPTVPNMTSTIPGGFVAWLGPDEWLVVLPDRPGAPDRPDPLDVRLRAAGGAVAMSAVDVSSVRTVLSLGGSAARTVLAHGCGLDLDAAVFPPGRCAQSRLALAHIVLVAPTEQPAGFGADPHFLILVRASFAPYLAAWLLDAATEYLTGDSSG